MSKQLPGILLRSPSSVFGEKVYYVARGCRHWVRNGAWLNINGFRWPDDVTDVDPAILYSFLNRGHAPLRSSDDISMLGLTSVDMREVAASQLRGTGIEFGAGASPFPVPLNCNVLFADAFAYEQLFAEMYPGQSALDLIDPDYKTDMQSLIGVADASLDFVIACHVIEHTTNPIAAIKSCHRALKAGGSLVLVVPDMTKTFDSNRQLTLLSHLIEDFQSPSRERDLEHYEEFYTKAFTIPSGCNTNDFVLQKHSEEFSIHFHTWTYESFDELIQSISLQTPWSAIWQHPTLHGAENIEFYFVLTK